MTEFFIIGGGPSCAGFDFSKLRPFETIGCNSSSVHAKTKYLFSMDINWIKNNTKTINKYLDKAHLATCYRDNISGCVFFYDKATGKIFSYKKHKIAGRNSGHGAVNLACHLGAKTVNLLGFDFGNVGHWHSGPHMSKQKTAIMKQWAKSLDDMKPYLDNIGVNVINWNENSLLQAYEKRPIDDLDKCLLQR